MSFIALSYSSLSYQLCTRDGTPRKDYAKMIIFLISFWTLFLMKCRMILEHLGIFLEKFKTMFKVFAKMF